MLNALTAWVFGGPLVLLLICIGLAATHNHEPERRIVLPRKEGDGCVL